MLERRKEKKPRRNAHGSRNLAVCRELGSQDLWGGRMRRSPAHGSLVQGGCGLVRLALALGGFPQGDQDRLPDGTPQSAKHRGPVEDVSDPDPDCLAFAPDPASGTASH